VASYSDIENKLSENQWL